MARCIANPFRGTGLTHPDLADVPFPSVDAAAPRALLARCPHAGITPLSAAPALADDLGVGQVLIKDERSRMGLGSFKALGAAYVIACDAEQGEARGRTYVTASAGNHGLSVAAGAAAFGAQAVIFLADTVPESFADRLRDIGAKVPRAGADYEASMAAAMNHAEAEGAALLSDSSWAGYTTRPHQLMEGYLALMAEVFDQIDAPPTHLFLQAGVGGLAGAAATIARVAWGSSTRIIVVEPEAAPCLIASVEAGAPVETTGPASAMGRLDCKVPSLIALKGLARDADDFMTISEAEGEAGATLAAAHGFASTPSGAAGLAGLAAAEGAFGLSAEARVLLILSERGEG
ncbi:pyridoxal-phosphate dependent enzyme [uncultured Tateyamaria sp.]|uniref:pyridoxal-phosphate dependent enzyme n=1 Tax=uncultured Tateyamaria sp. TaxID=455651 RepID=UPI002632D499|nr:pyridoxal-phosphate dependent enzyme [uncultured Tateyamaria sp.]